MKTNLYHRDKLRLARIGYFSKERNGVVMEKSNAYAIVYPRDCEHENDYYNVFDEEYALPVFKRSRVYSNYTRDGEAFGTKVYQVGGNVETGPCYVIEDSSVLDCLPNLVTRNSIKELIYRSKSFFPDRLSLLKNDTFPQMIKHFFQLIGDNDKYIQLADYFNRHDELGIQYVKK